MFKRNMGLIVMLLILLSSVTVYAAMGEKDVAKILDAIKNGKGYVGDHIFPSDQMQHVEFGFGGLYYVIDIKAKMCFAKLAYGNGAGAVIVPCKTLKEAYPLIAPVITWEK